MLIKRCTNGVIFGIRQRSSSAIAQSIVSAGKSTEWENAIPYSEMPGPKPIPFLGNTWRFIPYVGDFEIEHIDKISKRLYQKHGSVVKISGLLGRPDMVFLYDPNEIERVFRLEDGMPHRPSMPSLNYYKHVLRKDFFGDNLAGVIAVHGENWANFRSKVQQAMLQPRISKMYVKPIEETANSFVKRTGAIRDQNNEMPDDFLNYVHKWSLESIARVALDVRLGCLDENSNEETQTLIDAVNKFFINVPILELKIPFWRLYNTPTFKEYVGALDTITGICMKHVNASLENLQRNPVTSPQKMSLLQRVLESESSQKIATVLALDLFLVGIDTTSNAVASILYQLSIHPEVQQKLYEELVEVMPDKNSPLDDFNQLKKLSYLRACIKETLRMFPVVIGNGRCTTSDIVVGGFQIPKGVQIVFQHYAISNMDKYFTNSQKFEPERWLRKNPNYNHHPFASLPFGHGKRMCLGRRFADLEMQMVVAKMIRNYKIEYHYDKLDYFIHPMYTPNGPLKFKLIDRNM